MLNKDKVQVVVNTARGMGGVLMKWILEHPKDALIALLFGTVVYLSEFSNPTPPDPVPPMPPDTVVIVRVDTVFNTKIIYKTRPLPPVPPVPEKPFEGKLA